MGVVAHPGALVGIPREGGTIDSLSPTEWERRLTAHYLREDGPFGGATLQYLDATPAEIASAAGFEGTTDLEAQTAFLSQFDCGSVSDWLDGRRTASPRGETPGYFRYLVLTALVTATEEGAGGSHNFRTRLGQLLGRGQGMQAVSGVNDLWNALSVWSKARRASGHPIRPIKLPPYGRANRIGIAVQVAFPSWRDRQALTSILENLPTNVRRSVSRLTRELARPHYAGICSPNLSATFGDFADGLAAGRADLADHRFWRLVESVEQRLEDRRRARELTRWRFGAIFNGPEQDAVEIEVTRRDGRSHDRAPMFHGPFQDFLDTSENRLPKDLVRLREAGTMVLGEAPGGLWMVDDLGTPRSWTVVIMTQLGSDVHSAPLATAWTTIGSGWVVSDPMPTEATRAVLRDLGLEAARREDLVGVSLVDGVATRRGSWLGRPAYLPRVCAPEDIELALTRQDSEEPSLSLNGMRLESRDRLTGCWLLRARSGGGTAERRFYLESEVPERDVWPSKSKGFDSSIEVDGGVGAALGREAALPKDVPPSPALLDLMEALYARGTASIPEGDFVELVGRALPDRRWAWDVMRAFAEAGWTDVSVSSGWRARRWTLCPPSLIALTPKRALVEGALSAAARRRLAQVVEQLGGAVICNGEAPWSPDVVVAAGLSPEVLAGAIGWPMAPAEPIRLNAAPACWPVEGRTTEGRELTSVWSFNAGLFLQGSQEKAGDGWRLERWVRRRGDDRDLFRLVGPGCEWLTTVRSAAILEAHRRSGQSLFTWSDDALRRRGADGHLPLTVARALRRSMLRQTGPTIDSEGRRTYCYPAGLSERDWLLDRFGAVIEPAANPVDGRSWSSRAVASRRRGRPLTSWSAPTERTP